MKDFIFKLSEEILEETPIEEINGDTLIEEIEEWDSMCVMLFIGLADSSYNKPVTGEDIEKCKTIKDLHNLIS